MTAVVGGLVPGVTEVVGRQDGGPLPGVTAIGFDGETVGDVGPGADTGVVGPIGEVGGGVTEVVSEMVGGAIASPDPHPDSVVRVNTTGTLSEAVEEVDGR